MKRVIIIIFSHVAINTAVCQVNLVPNPSFEIYSSCPNIIGFENAVNWINPNSYSPDYFNTCENFTSPNFGVPSNGYGNQNARTGMAYAGIYLPVTTGNSLREYIQAELDDSLLAGTSYLVKFFVSLAENCADYSVNSIGSYFSKTAINSNNNFVLNAVPQILNPSTNHLVNQNSWIEISGIYIAAGGEKYITIGNFQNDSIVDTTNLVPVPSIQDMAYYYIDDVSVEVDPNALKESESNDSFSFSPNPISDQLKIELTTIVDCSIGLTDFTGKNIFLKQVKENVIFLDLEEFSDGIYVLQLFKNNKLISNNKIIIQH
jgi:hypothetical protein